MSRTFSPLVRVPAPSWEHVASLYKDSNNMVYRVSTVTGKPARSLARLAIRARLFQKDGLLLDALLGVHASNQGSAIALVTHETPYTPAQYVGVCVVEHGFCQTYVRPQWRRRGLGSQLLNLLRQRGVRLESASLGIRARSSQRFWVQNGIKVKTLYP